MQQRWRIDAAELARAIDSVHTNTSRKDLHGLCTTVTYGRECETLQWFAKVTYMYEAQTTPPP